MSPRRIQWGSKQRFAKAKLADLSDHVVLVSRPRKWGNPFPVEEKTKTGHAAAVEKFRRHLIDNPHLIAEARYELAGWDLACACAPGWPCHADVLLRVAAGGAP